MRSALGFVLLAALLCAPLASAQLPTAPAPTYTLTIQNAPAAFGTLTGNSTGSVMFQVVLALENVVCANAVTVPVTITAAPASPPAFFSVAPEPSVINITIAAGPHGPGSPGGGTGDVTLTATLAEITANASVPITVTAEAPAPAGAPQGCQGAGQVGGASAAPVTIFANMTAPPPAVVEEIPAEDKSFLPGPGALMGILAALVVALGMRGRR